MQPAASVWPSLLTLVILVRAWREKRKSVEFYPTLKATVLEGIIYLKQRRAIICVHFFALLRLI